MRASACLLITIALSACTAIQRDSSAREWARSECNRVIDAADRERCMKRVDDTYGSGTPERRELPRR
jgi:hypothetical protein